MHPEIMIPFIMFLAGLILRNRAIILNFHTAKYERTKLSWIGQQRLSGIFISVLRYNKIGQLSYLTTHDGRNDRPLTLETLNILLRRSPIKLLSHWQAEWIVFSEHLFVFRETVICKCVGHGYSPPSNKRTYVFSTPHEHEKFVKRRVPTGILYLHEINNILVTPTIKSLVKVNAPLWQTLLAKCVRIVALINSSASRRITVYLINISARDGGGSLYPL